MAEVEKTLAMIKPDAVRAGKSQEIMQLIELNGFTIIAKQKLQLTRSRAEEFYGEHNGKPFFPRLVNFMTSGPIWALVLAKPGAILGWRALMGPTNVFKAREEQPQCLRALYGTDGTQNATHGSDSPASAAREIKFYFPSLSPDPITEAGAAAEYITTRIQPALAKALAALAREKPSADKFEAITFIASYLLQNNPNKPKVLLPDEWDPALMGDEEDDEAEFINARPVGLADPNAEVPTSTQAIPVPASGDATLPVTSSAPAGLASSRTPTPPSGPVARPPSARPPSARPPSARPPSARPASSGIRPPSESGRRSSGTAAPPAVEEIAEPTPDEVSPDAMEEAATVVQAAFRGYQARKEVTLMRAEVATAEEEAQPEPEASGDAAQQGSGLGIELPPGVTEEMANEAAVRVQAHMRGYLARKEVAQMRAQQGMVQEASGYVEEGGEEEGAE